METLEAELLAVTEHKGKHSRKDDDDSEASASAGELDGVVDSDGAEEDPLDDAHDDDADDDEYGIDDDDDDDEFAAGHASKKKSGRSSKNKRLNQKSTPSSKHRPRPFDKKGPSRSRPNRSSSGELGDYDTDQFSFEYDEDGYGDAEDRERLSKMSEFDRELVLTERKDDRNKRFVIWQKKRELMARDADGQADLGSGRARSSNRSKGQSQSKTDALQALAADKRKKSSRAITLDDVSDADSEQEDRPKETKLLHNKLAPAQEIKTDEDLLKEKEGPDLRYDDIVKSSPEGNITTTPLFLRRDTLIHLSQKPHFDRVVQGLYVRPVVGTKDNSYLLCRIVGVRTGRVYELVDTQMNKFKTNKFLVLLSGKQRKVFEIRLVSGSHPRQHEFDVYISRAKEGGTEVPRREEVERLLKESTFNIFQDMAVATDEERKEHIANMEKVYPARVNWTQKRTELETALNIKRQDFANARRNGKKEEARRLESDIREMEMKLEEIRAMETKYVIQEKTSNAEVFENLARRNMKLNATNESLAARRRSFEASRASHDLSRDGMTQSLFMKSDRESTEKKANTSTDHTRGWSASHDWRKELVTWSPNRKRRRLAEGDPLIPGYDVAVPSMEDVVLDEKCGVQAKNSVSMFPPGIDAVYDSDVRPTTKAPEGARVISFEEWSRQRAS